MKKSIFSSLLLTFALAGGAAAAGQQIPLPEPDSAYRLGKGDLIEISVFGVEDFNYQVRIGSSGAVTLPYVGEVEAEGLTPAELAERLEAKMNGTLFNDPHVLIRVLEYRSSPVAILGSVVKPGTYQIGPGPYRLIDALAEAGGVAQGAGDFVIIQRSHEGDPAGEPEAIQIKLEDLLLRGVASLNLPLKAGDVVSVPPAEKAEERLYYVIGEVFRPGVFTLPTKTEVYLTQAVAAAGGPLKTAKTKKGILVRYGENGERQEIAINFQHMLEGKQDDILVQSRDVIFIPGSNFKTIGYGLLGVIPGAVQQSATSGVVR